jgi:hypothetical protein
VKRLHRISMTAIEFENGTVPPEWECTYVLHVVADGVEEAIAAARFCQRTVNWSEPAQADGGQCLNEFSTGVKRWHIDECQDLGRVEIVQMAADGATACVDLRGQ